MRVVWWRYALFNKVQIAVIPRILFTMQYREYYIGIDIVVSPVGE